MTHLPPDDRRWQEFLRKHRPIPPPPATDLEDHLMKAVEKSQHPALNRRLWAISPALAAGLLMAWSSYRVLVPVPKASNSASLEAFLENSWNDVMQEAPTTPQSSNSQSDWMLTANTAQ